MAEIREGFMPFRGYRTYYRIIGKPSERFPAPLMLLHGEPGSTHNYFEVMDALADEGMQLIMYDQLGCGLSYVEGHPEWWSWIHGWMNWMHSGIRSDWNGCIFWDNPLAEC